MLRTVRAAQVAASAKLPAGVRVEVLANASDGLGASYGAHLDILTTRTAFEDIFRRRSHYLPWLASFQVSAIVVSGQGKVGSERPSAPVDYQISQRADFFDRLTSVETMANRGIVNRRDEPLCGSDPGLARLHVICFDPMLCHVARYVTVGAMQIAVAMVEAGDVDPALLLDSPIEALEAWSRDPSLRATARLADGRPVTIVDLQRLFFTHAARFVAAGRCEGYVPGAARIVDTWGNLLDALEGRNFDALAPRLDWVLKQRLIEHALACRPDLSWQSPAVKTLDHLYASLGDEGLFVTEDRAGHIERVALEPEIARARREPPEDTRAWARAMVLRWHRDAVADLDWDWIDLLTGIGEWPTRRRVLLCNPLAHTKAECGGSRSALVAVAARADEPGAAERNTGG
jgi:proteasome accessory factor A